MYSIAKINISISKLKHSKCKGHDDVCDYETLINCDDCKYGGYTEQSDKRYGKDPEAKCNKPKENFK